jgi:pimeloyl-ACP methyl ester carboxylesterase
MDFREFPGSANIVPGRHKLPGVTVGRRVWSVVVALAASGVFPASAPPSHADPPVPIEDYVAPGEPVARDFPADFLPRLPVDEQEQRAALKFWTDPHVGGWGGTLAGGASCAGWSASHPDRTPVVFMHGTTLDAEFWRNTDSGDGTVVNVRQRFITEGYDPCELWALSYDGSPGYFTYDDVNVDEAYAFFTAVRDYLGASQIDVIAHSLGVTVTRKTAFEHPDLYTWLHTFVAIAGPNHGSTTCVGLGRAHYSYVCEELEPGSAWLAELNAGPGGTGEAPPGPRYLALYEGTGTTDNFYLGPDGQSPRLDAAGVCNHQIPYQFHNSLAGSEPAVSYYVAFVEGAGCVA